jgi:hypothetical protein
MNVQLEELTSRIAATTPRPGLNEMFAMMPQTQRLAEEMMPADTMRKITDDVEIELRFIIGYQLSDSRMLLPELRGITNLDALKIFQALKDVAGKTTAPVGFAGDSTGAGAAGSLADLFVEHAAEKVSGKKLVPDPIAPMARILPVSPELMKQLRPVSALDTETVEPQTASAVPTTEELLRHPAIHYLRIVFEPGDRVCIKLIHATETYPNTKNPKTQHPFYDLEDVLATETIAKLVRANLEGWHVFACMNPFVSKAENLRISKESKRFNHTYKPDPENPGKQKRENDPNGTFDNQEHRAMICISGMIRAVFAEIDNNGDRAVMEVRAAAAAGEIPKPHFINQSSPGKYQLIWLVQGFDLPMQRALNERISKRFGADDHSVDGARVLRIPGFLNTKPKYDPKPTVITVEENPGPRSKLEDFKIDLSKIPAAPAKSAKPTNPVADGEVDHSDTDGAAHSNPDDFDRPLSLSPTFPYNYTFIPCGHRDSEIYRIACRLREWGDSKEEIIPKLVEAFEKLCAKDGSDYVAMCQQKADSACQHPAGHGKDNMPILGPVTAATPAPAERSVDQLEQLKESREEAVQNLKSTMIEAAARQADEIIAGLPAVGEPNPTANLATASAAAPAVSTRGFVWTPKFALPESPDAEEYRDYIFAPATGELDGWFPRGDVSIIGGASGSNKSTLIMDGLDNQARGQDFLGHRTFGLPYLILTVDRGDNAQKRTLERMNLDYKNIPIGRLKASVGPTMLDEICRRIEQAKVFPAAVFFEGADMVLEDAGKMQFVVPFVSGLQEICRYYHIAIILSVGAPKFKSGEGYTAKRDMLFGSIAWGRMAETIVVLQCPDGDDTSLKRELSVLLRNGPAEKFSMVYDNGKLIVDKEITTATNEPKDIAWYKRRAFEGWTDPDKK